MYKITILSDLPKYSRIMHDLSPVYKFSKDLNRKDIEIKVVYHYSELSKSKSDIIILMSRYFDFNNIRKYEESIIEFIEQLKKHTDRIFWFDSCDTSGCPDLFLVDYVDKILKKQVLKDRNNYNNKNQIRLWIENGDSQLNLNHTQLSKFEVAWNIGLDNFTLSKYFSFLQNIIFPNLKFTGNETKKKYNTVFRGQTNYSNKSISEQRNQLLTFLNDKKDTKIITGSNVSKSKFTKEMNLSKVIISPFGWGEVCFRDFEAIASGALLIKPNMSHIETWPPIYEENKTYLSVDWKLNDLEEVYCNALLNYDEYSSIITNGQSILNEYRKSADLFVAKMKQIIQ